MRSPLLFALCCASVACSAPESPPPNTSTPADQPPAGEGGAALVDLEGLADLSPQSLPAASQAASSIGALCSAEPSAPFLPQRSEQTPEWRERCSSATIAVDELLAGLRAVEEERRGRGPAAENTPEEDHFVLRAVGALGTTLQGNPELPERAAVLEALHLAVTRPDTAQDLRISLEALQLLGRIGDRSSIPSLVRGLFIRGTRRPVALQEVAREAILLLPDQVAMTDALVKAGQIRDGELMRMQGADPEFDVRLIKEQVAITLGMINYPSAKTIRYLMEELEHDEVDDFDRIPSRGIFRERNWDAPLWKGYRRSWAAQALAKLHHEPALPILLERMRLTKRGDQFIYAEGVGDVEIPGYIDALGDFLAPERTNEVLMPFVLYGDDARIDRAGRRIALQADAEYADRLEARAQKLAECDEELRRYCVKNRLEEIYIPALRASEGCTTIECWTGRLGEEDEFLRVRAAHQLAMLAWGETEDLRGPARQALIEALMTERSEEVVRALTFAIDRLSLEGCDQGCLDQLEARARALWASQETPSIRRSVSGLRGRLAGRAR